MNLNNKTFSSHSNSPNGDVSGQTLFKYCQEKDVIWAEYSGGIIQKGSLIGKVLNHEEIEFNYQHITLNMELRAGHCISKVNLMEDGRIKLTEHWKWFTDSQSECCSELIEVTRFCTSSPKR